MSESDDRTGAADRARRLAAIFGAEDDQTRDDLPDPGDPAERTRETDEWLHSQVPPHHG